MKVLENLEKEIGKIEHRILKLKTELKQEEQTKKALQKAVKGLRFGKSNPVDKSKVKVESAS